MMLVTGNEHGPIMTHQAQPQSMTNSPSSASVKLRRRNKTGGSGNSGPNGLNGNDKKKNRHSGDFFYWSPSRQLQEERKNMRKSGDWSYVSFPAQMNGLPTGHAPLSLTPTRRAIPEELVSPGGGLSQPTSLLESKVIASIIQNETSRSAHGSPVRHSSPGPRCNSAMETLDRKVPPPLPPGNPGSNPMSRRRISNDITGGLPFGGLYSNPALERDMNPVLQVYERDESPHQVRSSRVKNRSSSSGPLAAIKRRSQSHTRASSDNNNKSDSADSKSNGNVSKTPQPSRPRGLGRRSATQLELSNRKKSQWDESGLFQTKSRWKSQEQIHEVGLGVMYT